MTHRSKNANMLVDGIHHVAILTADTDRLVRFYRAVFDAVVEDTTVDSPVRLTFLNIGPEHRAQHLRDRRQPPSRPTDTDVRPRAHRPPRCTRRLDRRLHRDPPPPHRPGGNRRIRHRLRAGAQPLLHRPRRPRGGGLRAQPGRDPRRAQPPRYTLDQIPLGLTPSRLSPQAASNGPRPASPTRKGARGRGESEFYRLFLRVPIVGIHMNTEEHHEWIRRTTPGSVLRRHLRRPRPRTGKEIRRWHPAGTDRAKAEKLDREARRRSAEQRVHAVRSLTFGAYLTSQWLPAKKLHLATSTYRGYERNVQHHILPVLGRIGIRGCATSRSKSLYESLLHTQPTARGSRRRPSTRSISHPRALTDAHRRGLVDPQRRARRQHAEATVAAEDRGRPRGPKKSCASSCEPQPATGSSRSSGSPP